jgi:hypothetical protein
MWSKITETNLLSSHSLALTYTHACVKALLKLKMSEGLRSLVIEMLLKERISHVCHKTEVKKNMPVRATLLS